jgi:hypothetical protein
MVFNIGNMINFGKKDVVFGVVVEEFLDDMTITIDPA